jgi:enediyne biosynthesis protein E4
MKKIMSTIYISWLLIILLSNCKPEPKTLFRLLSNEDTGVDFINAIQETDTFNILTTEYIYNGGGVGVADFNNDGFEDIVFAGNLVPNRLYLNEGELRFKDVTEVASVNIKGRWNSGVSTIDINNDGWMDIYVCATMLENPADRRNMLFVNQGLNSDSIPVFVEEAGKYGIADEGYSVMAAFLDYDRDGDLDLYILTNERLIHVPTNYRPKITDGSSPNNDRLYRNNGNGSFTNVTKEAGILIEGFGLGLSVSDFNKDGWPDIYVSNDYLSNDLLYINNGDGTFKNRISEFVGHQSQFSMGNDAADINNDGLTDIITLDMLPETNDRKKTTIGNKSYQTYINNKQYGYEFQHVRNMLHLNNGLHQNIKFSEIGQLAGIHQTEWSWSPLFADFDNDGYKDLIVTNGFPKDITDKDFSNYRADVGNVASPANLIDSIPVVKIPNYGFQNRGDLTFKDVTNEWGLGTPSFSNGAAFADLDNDGDLDYLINNINDVAFIYENTLYSAKKKTDNNYLRVKLKGNGANVLSVGAKATIYYDKGKTQYAEESLYRGFLSSVEPIIHFGIGKQSSIDSLLVQWPDGKTQLLKNISANQLLTVNYQPDNSSKPQSVPTHLFKKADINISYKHSEDDKIDFNLQRTLPHKFSQSGPAISVGDVNNDKLEDFVIGGSVGHAHSVFVQKPNGSFTIKSIDKFDANKKEEDEGLLLFDADNDNDLDLYVVSGSVESPLQSKEYQDRLYINDGKGNFKLSALLKDEEVSGSCVRAADFDADGDLDLFVGGRIVPGAYPNLVQSFLLRNDQGRFSNVAQSVCSDLNELGMVTDAIWTDFDADGKIDLIVVGEFMPITFFRNQNNKLIRLSDTGINNYTGWWNSIVAGDFDKDGDTDYIAGNLGLNNSFQVTNEFPLKIFAKDFDGNGSIDPVLACYQRVTMNDNSKQLYPVHFWDEMNSQSPKFRRKFSRYRQYSKATIDQVLTADELKGASILEANFMQSAYIENQGKGKFTIRPLPVQAQFAPVNGMVAEDVNHDGNLDVMIVGNDYGNEVFIGRYDASTGLILLGDGKGNFEPATSSKTGFYVSGDAKGLVKLSGAKMDFYMATRNNDSLAVFTTSRPADVFIYESQAMDSWVELIYNNGTKQRVELYYGSGYLSQSTRRVQISVASTIAEIRVCNSKGGMRTINPKVDK